MIVLLLIVCAFLSFFLGGIVLTQNYRKLTNLLFVGICLCFAVWAVTVGTFMTTDSADVAFIAAKGFYVAAGAFPTLLLLFSILFPKRYPVSNFGISLVILLGLVINVSVILDPHFVINSVSIENAQKVVSINKPTYILYSSYFVFYFFSAMYVAYRKYMEYRGALKQQTILYALGILLNSIPGFIANLILPYYQIYDYIWIGPIMSVLFLGLTAYSIIKHSFFDIRLATVRTTAYGLSLLTLSGVYYILAYIVSNIVFQDGTKAVQAVNPINIGLALVLAFIFQPVKRFFDRTTDKIFFHGMYNTDEFYARFNAVLSDTTDLALLLSNTSKELLSTLKSEYIQVVVLRNNKPDIQIGHGKSMKLPEQDIQTLITLLSERSDDMYIQSTDVIHSRGMRHLFTSHNIEILLPLFQQNSLIGFVAIGPRNSSQYSRRDTKLLSTISDELGIAIQNALSLQEVKDINAGLEQRIEHATQQLRTSNARLVRIDKTKDEFLNMASHQLRTPLTTVKGYLSMVLEGDAGKVSKRQEQLLGEAYDSSERMVHLIHDFLNVSRLQTGKFALELGEYDLHKIISDEISALKTAAKSRDIQIKFDDKAGKTMVNIDETKIRQVVMNFIDNAMYYTRPGGTITVHVEKHSGKVEVRVVDNGIGVPRSEQAHLFSKFFRASNARKQRPDGTGVGIYLAKKIVDAHHGEIIFESQEGKGSTFGFRLPLKK